MRDAELVGRWAFITGAARGQGRSHALDLARHGANLILCDVDADIATVPYPLARAGQLAQVARQAGESGARTLTFLADVRDRARLRAQLADAVETAGAELDIVVANAGIFSHGTVDDLSGAAWDDMIDVNLTGVWNTVQAAVGHMRGAAGGAIVLTSSAAGLAGFEGIGHYVAAKHGVVGLTRVLARELGPRGIRVNCVCPTNVRTDMFDNQAIHQLFTGEPNPSAERFEGVASAGHVIDIPWVEPQDVSNLVTFLVSDRARYITGAAIPVDAGRLVKL